MNNIKLQATPDNFADDYFRYEVIVSKITNEIGWHLTYIKENANKVRNKRGVCEYRCKHTVKGLPVISLTGTFDNYNHVAIDISRMDTRNVVDMSGMFDEAMFIRELDFSNIDTSNVVDMSGAFACMHSLRTINLKNVNTTKVKTFKELFDSDLELEELDLSSFRFDSAENIESMFCYCRLLKSITIKNKITHVEHINNLFNGCGTLKKLDLSSIEDVDTEEFNQVFSNCKNLRYLDIRNLNIHNKCFIFDNNFRDCNNLKIIIAKNDSLTYDSSMKLEELRVKSPSSIDALVRKVQLLNTNAFIYCSD